MRIGIDIDGVILDSERILNFYADYYAHFDLGKKKMKNDSVFIEENYDFTKEETDEFFARYFDLVTSTCPFVPGAKEMLKKLEDDGNELYIVTMRGAFNDREIKFCDPRLNELGVNFKEKVWGLKDKSVACTKYNLDVMIEDNPEHIKKLLKTNTKVIQFKENEAGVPTVENPNVFVARNWMEVYLIVLKLQQTGSLAEK